MYIQVSDGVVGKKINKHTNVVGVSGKTYSDIRLVDRAARIADGIFDYEDNGRVGADEILASETLNIDQAAGTVTRLITTQPRPVQPELPIESPADAEQIVQGMLDSGAQFHGYDSIMTAVTYADESSVSRFQSEGAALRKWRSEVWSAAYALLAAHQTAVEQTPEGEDPPAGPTKSELIAALPIITLV